jgi:hypothetical protein
MTKYTMKPWMRNRYLSTSVYPYADSTTVNETLTDDSDPVAIVFNANADGVKKMSKPVTNIRMADDGTVSFDFMSPPSAIRAIKNQGDCPLCEKRSGLHGDCPHDSWFDFQGRRLPGRPVCKGLYIHNGKKESIR